MNNESIKIELLDFLAEDKFKVSLQEATEKIKWLSPSDSRLTFVIKKDEGNYCGQCQIISSAGVFNASENSDNPDMALLKLQKNIEQQLLHWKRTRFDSIA